jgi:C-terminal processing protease CtpA/Prc
MARIATLFAVALLMLVGAKAQADIPPPYEPYGIGASIVDAQPFPIVSNVTPGSPAANAGLTTGDAVIAIDGTYSKAGAPFYFFARGLQGPQNSSVELIVLRDNRQVLVLTVARSAPLR